MRVRLIERLAPV
jgi:hypothetical protein